MRQVAIAATFFLHIEFVGANFSNVAVFAVLVQLVMIVFAAVTIGGKR